MVKLRDLGIPMAVSLIITMPFLYAGASNDAHDKLNRRLTSKVERLADTDLNGSLDINEALSVYKTIGIDNPEQRLMERGFHLWTSEMQDYLRKTGNFDLETDNYRFSDTFQ